MSLTVPVVIINIFCTPILLYKLFLSKLLGEEGAETSLVSRKEQPLVLLEDKAVLREGSGILVQILL